MVDRAIAAHLAEALGAIAVLMSATVEYAKTRKQFGQPIGKFQVLQHRMVDMYIAEQQARSASLMANLKLGDADGRAPSRRPRRRSANMPSRWAKVRCRFMAASA